MPSINDDDVGLVLALAPSLPDDDVLDDATAPPVGAAVVLPAAAARAARCRCLASRAARMAAFWLLLMVLSVLLWTLRRRSSVKPSVRATPFKVIGYT